MLIEHKMLLPVFAALSRSSFCAADSNAPTNLHATSWILKLSGPNPLHFSLHLELSNIMDRKHRAWERTPTIHHLLPLATLMLP